MNDLNLGNGSQKGKQKLMIKKKRENNLCSEGYYQ